MDSNQTGKFENVKFICQGCGKKVFYNRYHKICFECEKPPLPLKEAKLSGELKDYGNFYLSSAFALSSKAVNEINKIIIDDTKPSGECMCGYFSDMGLRCLKCGKTTPTKPLLPPKEPSGDNPCEQTKDDFGGCRDDGTGYCVNCHEKIKLLPSGLPEKFPDSWVINRPFYGSIPLTDTERILCGTINEIIDHLAEERKEARK